MKDYILMADAGCDLSAEFQEKYDIKIINGHLVLPGKGDVPTFMEWKDVSREQFYAELKKNPNDYATAPPNLTEYETAFEPYIKEGKAIICVTISSAISGALDFATTARKNILAKYPDAKIKLIDSLRFGPGFGLMLVHASMLRADGKSFEEVVKYLEENRNRFHQAGWLDDLSFVAKKGRITHPKAFFGQLAGIKPIGEFDAGGLTTVLGKAKGAKAAYSVLMKYIEATIEDPEDQYIFIAQTSRYPQAEAYKKMIEEQFNPKAVYIIDVFPFCGINIGPGLMAAYYVGKPISEDLSAERALIEQFIAEAK
ncbi:MAG: DegV family protein [Ruminococcus sp.]|uniref:DegV family protein n=1 Tax=Ruminococcus sp. TaxID=41978 RepID=UPI0028737009|nr:DegV family protein [Ruminococcus sp.]MBQ3284303.1 DegV family protein [Ruminococcus sp.]